MLIARPEITSTADLPTRPYNCCSENTPQANWEKKIDLICRIALSLFAASIAPQAFSVSLSIGIILGIGYTIIRHLQNKPLLEESDTKPICAQGFMNYLSGMHYSPAVNSVVTAAFIGAHLRHDPRFFVPFAGLFVGIGVGRDGASMIGDLGSHFFSSFRRPKVQVVIHKCGECVH